MHEPLISLRPLNPTYDNSMRKTP